jgi:hypothetical protein
MDPGNPSAWYGEAARSTGRKPNWYPLFPSPSLTCGPYLLGHVTLLLPWTGDHAGDRFLPVNPPSSIPVNARPFRSLAVPIKAPRCPPSTPFLLPARGTTESMESIAGLCGPCEHPR